MSFQPLFSLSCPFSLSFLSLACPFSFLGACQGCLACPFRRFKAALHVLLSDVSDHFLSDDFQTSLSDVLQTSHLELRGKTLAPVHRNVEMYCRPAMP